MSAAIGTAKAVLGAQPLVKKLREAIQWEPASNRRVDGLEDMIVALNLRADRLEELVLETRELLAAHIRLEERAAIMEHRVRNRGRISGSARQ
jgi:hypothetical protein